MKNKLALVVVLAYISVNVLFFVLSAMIESERICYAAKPYWDYGFLHLPCYFFDSLYKMLMYPSYLLLVNVLPTRIFTTTPYFVTALVVNSIMVYFFVRLVRGLLVKKAVGKNN